MLCILRKRALQIESQVFKQFFFCSTAFNTEDKHDEHILKSDDKLILRKEGRKFLKVAIVGLPNVGKSTLINQLVNRSVCPASSKVHTTMHKAEAIYSENDTQIVFVDTPGLTTNHEMKKYKLAPSFRDDLESSIPQADVIGIIQDTANVYTRHKFDKFIIDYLKNKKDSTPLILIFNKVDKLKRKDVLLDLARLYMTNEEIPKLSDIFMISALTGDGVDDLRNYLLDSAKENDWQYEKESFINQPLKKIIEETVRATGMDFLPQDVPYMIKIQLEHLDVGQDGTINTLVNLECSRGRYIKYLLADKGKNLKTLAQAAEQRLQHGIRTRVILFLSVNKSKPNSKK